MVGLIGRVARLFVVCAIGISIVPIPVTASATTLNYADTFPASNEYAMASASGVAIQPGTGTVFVVDKTSRTIHRFAADGAHEAVFADASGEAFLEPSDVAADNAGNIYVADAGRGYVYKLDATTGALVEKLGSGLVDAVGIDWFSSGGQQHVYVADKSRGLVLRFSANSDTSTGFVFDAGGALKGPEDVAVALTPTITLWIADSVANKMTCVDFTDAVLTSWGTTGTADGELQSPVGIDIRGDGSLLISDGDRIQRFSQGGNFLGSYATSGTAAGEFTAPARLNVDQSNDRAYIADSGNARVQLLSADSTFVAEFGSGPGSAPGTFRGPRHIDVTSDGTIYVADALNHRIQRIDASGTVTVFGEQGTGSGQFDTPWAVTADGSGNIYVADTLNNRIQKLDASGTVLGVWGTSGSGPGQFNQPKAIAVDSGGFIYVADTGNWRVQKLSPAGSPVASWTSYLDGATTRLLYRPSDIAVGPDGHIFVFDGWGMRVAELRSDGTARRVWGSSWSPGYEFVGPWSGIDVSDSGNLFVADPTANMLRVHGADNGEGLVWQTLDSSTGPGQAKGISDIAVGPFGDVWVSDSVLNRIQRYQLPDATAPFTNRMGGTGEWSTASEGSVSIMRPTDWPAGPIATYASVDGAAPEVIWRASDEDSVTTYAGTFSFTSEGEHRLDYWSVDAYGNREDTQTAWTRLDRTSPTGSWTVTPSTWTTAASVSASFSATDAVSGVETMTVYISGATSNPYGALPGPYEGPYTIVNEGITYLSGRAKDKALNEAQPAGGVVRIDRTPPSTSLYDGSPGAGAPRTYSLIGSDSLSGVSTTYYRLDGAPLPSIGTIVTVSTPGTHTVEFWSVDNTGNTESVQSTQVVVAEDSTPPDATGFSIENSFGWTNKTAARATLGATGATQMRFSSDGAVWSAWQPYSTVATVTMPAAEGSFTMRAQFKDAAANTSELTFDIAVDRTKPVTSSNKADVVNVSPPAEITFAPNDSGSGPAGTYYRLDGGTVAQGFSVTTSAPGTHTVEFWSVDVAGNVETHQVHQFVVASPQAHTTTSEAVSTTLVGYGGAVTVYGVPRDDSSAVVSDGSVTVWTKPYGSSTWTMKDTAGWDAANGRFVGSVTGLTIGSYVQVRFEGTTTKAPSNSPGTTFVRVRPKVGTPVAPTSAYRGRRFTTYGSLYPAHPVGTSVRIYKYRYLSGRWVAASYVTAKTVSSTKYSISMTLPYAGRWRLRAYHSDGGHYATYSTGYDYITVK